MRSILTIFFLTILCLLSLNISMPTFAHIKQINLVEITSKKKLLSEYILTQELPKKEESSSEELIDQNSHSKSLSHF